MINKTALSACALTLLIALPSLTLAAPRDGGARPAAAPAFRPAPAPAFRPAPAPVSRPAPAVQAAPQPRPAPPQARPAPPGGGGFNFERDINPRPAPVTQQRPVVAPQQRAIAPQPRAIAPQNRPAVTYQRAPNTNSSGGPYRGRFTGPIVRNAHAPSTTWGWNHGVVWRPAPVYWGGGFWGSFAIAALADSLLFGSVIDDQDQLQYPSYQIQPDTPGAELLDDYQLQQTQCGPPNLVVIWGPDNSVICAIPNDTVGPGNYQVDPSTFTLVPAAP